MTNENKHELQDFKWTEIPEVEVTEEDKRRGLVSIMTLLDKTR